MKLHTIILWEESFTPKEFSDTRFQEQLHTHLSSILSKNDADSSIVKKWIEILKKIAAEKTLSPIEEFTLQCFKIRAQTSIIIDGIVEQELEQALENIWPAEMSDIIFSCTSQEDIKEMLAIIQWEYRKMSDLGDARDIFSNIDVKNIDQSELEMICSLLREFDFDGVLIAILMQKQERNIKILTNKSYKAEQNIVIQLDGETITPTFYLEGQALIKMQEIHIENPVLDWEKYYKWVTFWGKKWILSVDWEYVYSQLLDTLHLINGTSVRLIKNILWPWHHIYLPETNTIMLVSAVIIWTFYEDEHWLKINEDDEDFDEKIDNPKTKKIMRLIIDNEKWYYYDFDWEDFWELKILAQTFIHWKKAKNKLH